MYGAFSIIFLNWIGFHMFYGILYHSLRLIRPAQLFTVENDSNEITKPPCERETETEESINKQQKIYGSIKQQFRIINHTNNYTYSSVNHEKKKARNCNLPK